MHTPGPWRLVGDAQGPMMVMHPTRPGVAIASLTNSFSPAEGFHDDWYCWRDDGTLDIERTHARIAERNANVRLIAAAPDLLATLQEVAEYLERHASESEIEEALIRNVQAAIAKATGLPHERN